MFVQGHAEIIRKQGNHAVIPLPLSPQRHARSLAELIAAADRVPTARVFAALQHHIRAADILRAAGAPDSESLRHLVLAGALINRALFEIAAVPKDLSFRLSSRARRGPLYA